MPSRIRARAERRPVRAEGPGGDDRTPLEAVLEVMDREDHEIRVIGARHGEKRYETLLSSEEMAVAENRGHYFRVPRDGRGLNYDAYYTEGSGERLLHSSDFNSLNARQLDVDEMAAMLDHLPDIRRYLAREPVYEFDVRTVTVTGANGFVGRNLGLRLVERGIEVLPVHPRDESPGSAARRCRAARRCSISPAKTARPIRPPASASTKTSRPRSPPKSQRPARRRW